MSIEGEIEIHRPVDEVFDFVADERNEPRYNPRLRRVQKITPGPVALGTVFRAETTTMGRTVAMTIEITAYERPNLLASHTHLTTMDIQGTLTFESIPAGTQMGWLWHLEPHGALSLMTPFLTRIGRRQEKVVWDNLKKLLEAQQGVAPREGSARSLD